jgi:hypothetical protein
MDLELPDDIDGFDPLGSDATSDASLSTVFEEASRRIVHNILKCYTGYYDVFSELLQNSLDALQTRQRLQEPGYDPRVWIEIDIPASRIRVVDNGIGMSRDEFKFCLRPSVSFKRQGDLRGHKGVGATFLAYGFSFIKLQTKKREGMVAAILRQGRQWAEDTRGMIPRPKLEATEFGVPELVNESSGTCVEIIVGQCAGERPRDLGWTGAQNAQQWLDVLRIKTPLGGIYLSTSATSFRPGVSLTVKASEGTTTSAPTGRAEYYYPHEIPNLKAQSLGDLQKAMAAISGDAATVFTKLGSEFKRLDCIWDVWDKDQILCDDSSFASALGEEDKLLVERHRVTVYACFLRSAKLWAEFNDDVLKLRKGQKIIHGGLQVASDYMPQGDLSIIPLTSTIGYQANSHVIVHFTDGDPDMGRKTFQPELKDLAEALAVRAVNTMKRFLQHMKPDTGANMITPDRELHEWKRNQENYRERNPLSFTHGGEALAMVSAPQQEQDVIAIFHELVGLGVLKGYRFYATTQSDRYDSLFFMDYQRRNGVLFDVQNCRLGISRSYELPYITEPKVLEYKYTFDSLVSDFSKEEKFARQIDFVVCWQCGRQYKERFYLQSLLIGDEGSNRQMYGATHQAFQVGSQQSAFEVLIVEDLLNWLRSPTDEEARQKRIYRDM